MNPGTFQGTYTLHPLDFSAMNVNEDTDSRRLGATNKVCLYFIIATLGVLLVFALATIMILVVQRTPSVFFLTLFISVLNPPPLCLLDICVYTHLWRYLTVNSSKLSLVEKGICEGIKCQSPELVIREHGLYLIFCNLNFHFPNCSKSPIDLKIDLLVNDRVDRQTLSTFCASETCQDETFKTLLQLHLTHLDKEDKISVTLNHPEFLNDVSLPNENVLGVLKYNDEM
uniref:TNF superfamily member 8 n=1 Tax=Junco hyemalis TaxID=40217 RepID=A0A8C5JDN6_JUNHY